MKKLSKPSYPDYMILLARVLMGGLFIWAGIGKIMNFEGTMGYMASVGFPMASVFLVLTIMLQIGAGLMLLTGYFARVGALLLALFTVAASLIFHTGFAADPNQVYFFTKNIMIIAGLLSMSAYGAGKLSLDYKIRH